MDEEPPAMSTTMIGLDTAKAVFQVHAVDEAGKTAMKRKLQRSELIPFFERQEACTVVLEACGAGHHWARLLGGLGHEVKGGLRYRPISAGARWEAGCAIYVADSWSHVSFGLTRPHASGATRDGYQIQGLVDVTCHGPRQGRRCWRTRFSSSGAKRCTQRYMVVWSTATPRSASMSSRSRRSEERRVGKECRSRWSPYH